jgi:hypothetical protein
MARFSRYLRPEIPPIRVVYRKKAPRGHETRRIRVDKGYHDHTHAQKFRVWISGQVRTARPAVRYVAAPPSSRSLGTGRGEPANGRWCWRTLRLGAAGSGG